MTDDVDNEDVRQIMLDDRDKYDTVMENLQNGNTQETRPHIATAEDFKDILGDYATETDNSRVGNWNAAQLVVGKDIDYDYKRPEILPLPDRPDAFITRAKLKIESESSQKNYLAITHTDGSITMNGTNASRAQTTNNLESKRYLLGDPIVRNSVLFHEVNHAKDHDYLQLDRKYQTPLNFARLVSLSESVSFSVSFLSTVYQYDNLKRQGATTIQVDGEDKPLEYILETYPKLKETYQKYGLDVSDPKSLKHYVKIALDYKHLAKGSYYDKQAYNEYCGARDELHNKPFSARVNEAKTEDADFEKISHLMTSKVYIGQNTCVDLSSCYDMLNDMSKEDVYALVERCSNGQEYVLPAQNLIEISEYLDKKGIKDDEKDKYLELQLSYILGKEDGVDQGLKELMLKSQAMHNNGSAEIVYNDGAVEVFDLTPKQDKQLAYNIALAAQKSR